MSVVAVASAITIGPAYGWVVLSAAGMGLTCLFMAQGVSDARDAVFKTKAFQNREDVKAMRDQIKKRFPSHDWSGAGYPDNGNGKLGQLLSPADWYLLSNAQRAHNNTMETLPLALTLVLTAGMFQPELAAISGLVYCVGRRLGASGYVKDGPKGRFPWWPVSILALIVPLSIDVFYGLRHGLASQGITLY